MMLNKQVQIRFNQRFSYLAKQLDRESMMMKYHKKALAENIAIFGPTHSVTRMTQANLKERCENVCNLQQIMLALGCHSTYKKLRKR